MLWFSACIGINPFFPILIEWLFLLTLFLPALQAGRNRVNGTRISFWTDLSMFSYISNFLFNWLGQSHDLHNLGLRECSSSGEDVLVNAVIILRNWGTIPSTVFWGMMTALTDTSDPKLQHSHCYQVKTFSKLRSKFPHRFFLDPFNGKIALVHFCH